MNQDINSRLEELRKEQEALQKVLDGNPFNASANARWLFNNEKIKILENAIQTV